MLRLRLKLFTGHASPRTSWVGPHRRPSSASACPLPRTTWHDPQSSPQMATDCARIGVALRGQAANQGYLSLCQTHGCSTRCMGHTEVRCCSFGFCESLRNFGNVCSMSQDKPFTQNSHYKLLGCAQSWLGWGLRESRLANGLARSIQTEIWWPLLLLACQEWGRVLQRNNCFC